jgi:hypothetical protein
MTLLKIAFGISLVFFGFSAIAIAQTEPAEHSAPENLNGQIHFLSSNGSDLCSLTVPATTQRFDFSEGSNHCENNRASSFWLENVPSATLIQLYENAQCSDAQNKDNYFIKLKTVKSPTTWDKSQHVSIDSLRDSKKGALLPGRYTRIEQDSYVGADLAGKNLNERLSCVYIERSQPAN